MKNVIPALTAALTVSALVLSAYAADSADMESDCAFGMGRRVRPRI